MTRTFGAACIDRVLPSRRVAHYALGFMTTAEKKARLAPGLVCESLFLLCRLLAFDLQFDAAVALTAFRGVVGVDRLALAEALRTIQTAGIHAMRRQVVVHALCAAL